MATPLIQVDKRKFEYRAREANTIIDSFFMVGAKLNDHLPSLLNLETHAQAEVFEQGVDVGNRSAGTLRRRRHTRHAAVAAGLA